MAAILEVTSGPFAGKRIAVMGGQTITAGRTSRANFSIPHDTFMSGIHFSVELGPKGCVLTDQKSSNGTFVNGARVAQVALNHGDEVRSGSTIFAVRIVDEASFVTEPKSPPKAISPLPQPLPMKPIAPSDPGSSAESTTPLSESEYGRRQSSLLAARKSTAVRAAAQPSGKSPVNVGGWTLSMVPKEWSLQGDSGIQRDIANSFPSSAVATEEPLGNGASLHEYVESQLAMLRKYLREPQIEAAVPPKIDGAEETIAVEVLYKTKDGQAVFYRRVYARTGRTVGVLTFTTLQTELGQVRPAFDAIIGGARFASTPNV